MTASRTYDVYGLARSTNGAPASKHAFVGSLGHTSEDDTGLVYMRARWVDPAVGRFVSEDPGKDGANWFEYCRGNPANAVDATGKQATDIPDMLELLRSWGLDLTPDAANHALVRYFSCMFTCGSIGLGGMGMMALGMQMAEGASVLAAVLPGLMALAAVLAVGLIVAGLILMVTAVALGIMETIDCASTDFGAYASGDTAYRPKPRSL